MQHRENRISLLFAGITISIVSAGISPLHDIKAKRSSRDVSEKFMLETSHGPLKHLDNSILKATRNITQNPQMEEVLYQISKNLVSSILSKLQLQDKITRITEEALQASGKSKGITAIETRRILDYISRTLSSHILSITRSSADPELHRLVYGLAQIAAEVSIVSALKDMTYAKTLTKKQFVDLPLRKKRSIDVHPKIDISTSEPTIMSTVYSILSKKSVDLKNVSTNTSRQSNAIIPNKPFSVITRDEKKSLHVIPIKPTVQIPLKRFLNQTVLDIQNKNSKVKESEAIVLDKPINGSHIVTISSPVLELYETDSHFRDGWMDIDERSELESSANFDFVDNFDNEDESKNEKMAKQRLEKLESRAKKAILYAGDVAFLSAASVVAMRRALTASIEVQMSVKYARNGMLNHQELMMNLAKTAAQQAGKEAKSAASKSLACERVAKLAVKYAIQSDGARLNNIANRIIMDTLSLTTLAKSMAFVSSDIAINSLYQATDVKPPS